MKIYKDSIGLLVQVNCNEDISNASQLLIFVKKPSGRVITWTAFKIQNYPTKIGYITVSGDLDEIGTYKVQVHVTFPSSGWVGLGETTTFEILDDFM